jgi:hypothetical protein
MSIVYVIIVLCIHGSACYPTWNRVVSSHKLLPHHNSFLKVHWSIHLVRDSRTESVHVSLDRQTLGRHCLLLDEAVDEYFKAFLDSQRGISFFGASFASDESPPAGSRFSGYRFQVTYLYVPWVADPSTWDRCDRPPIKVEPYLLDVCHCPGKDGSTVMGVITKQLSRVGLSILDIASGCGDGGGENEGVQGVHRTLELAQPSYIRRRCLGHISWRVADAGIDFMGTLSKDVLALNTYLHEGITWRRLQSIATQPLAAGGLALMRESSETFKSMFGVAPGSILDGRPETESHFLLWLIPRESTLVKCIERDLDDRSLADTAKTGLRTLQDPLGKVRRAISAELLERALYLFRWGKLHKRIATETTFNDLLQRCMGIITSMFIDDQFMMRFGLERADLVAANLLGRTWVDVLIHIMVEDEQLRHDCGPEIYQFQQGMTTRISTHLQLTMENVARFSWLLGALLQSNPTGAQAAARSCLLYLLTNKTTNPLAGYIAANETLMQQLTLFADAPVATCLWQAGGRYKDLFIFIGIRFISCPDHVLDCEGIHSRWQWLEKGKRNVKLKMLNSILRLSSYVNHHGDLPALDSLIPYIQHIRQQLRERYDQVMNQGDVAAGLRIEWVYKDRFNLGLADLNLLRDPAPRHSGSSSPAVLTQKRSQRTAGLSTIRRPDHAFRPCMIRVFGRCEAPLASFSFYPPQVAWNNYIRSVLVVGGIFRFEALGPQRWFKWSQQKHRNQSRNSWYVEWDIYCI